MTDSNTTFTVTTYNIRLGIQQGLSAIADALATTGGADILALQEVGNRWIMGPDGDSTTTLAAALQMPHHIHVPTIEQQGPDGRPARYGHALLSRWPIRNHEIIPLPRLEDEPRAMLHALVDAPFGTIDIISTHLSHILPDRPEQGRFLLDWLDENPGDANSRFLLGDLNADDDEAWLRELLSRFTDADSDVQRPTFPSKLPERRIDYILSQGAHLEVVDVPTLAGPSDHRPVVSRWVVGSSSHLVG